METKVIELQVNTNLDKTNSDVQKLSGNLKNAESGAKDFDKSINTKKSSSFKELGGAIGDIVPGFGAASSGAGTFNKALLTLVANPIGLVIASVTLVLGSLYAIFKDFTPVVDKVEQGMSALSSVVNTIKNSFIALFTGTKSLSEAFGGLGVSMSKAATEAIELTKAQQDLDDAMDQQDITIQKLDNRIAKLNVQAKNRNLTEKQQLEILKEAEKLEKAKLAGQIDLADKSVKIARANIAKAAQLNAEEIKQLKIKGLAYKEDIEKRTTGVDELFANLKKAITARESLEGASIVKLEKNQNKQDAIFEKQQAQREKADADRITRNEKAEAERVKQNEKQAAEDTKENEQIRASGERSRQEYEDNEKLIADARKRNLDAGKTENQLKVEAEIADYETKKQRLIDANLSTEQIEIEHKRKLAELDTQYYASEADKSAKSTADAKANADAKKAIADAEAKAKLMSLDAVSNGLSLASEELGASTAAGKVAAVAAASISTYTAIAGQLAAFSKVPIPGYAIAQAIVTGLTGLAQVKKILSVKTPKGGGGGGSAPSVSSGGNAIAAPNFNVVGTSGQNQIAQTLNREQPPVKAYVVANDVSTQQSLDRNIVKSASVG